MMSKPLSLAAVVALSLSLLAPTTIVASTVSISSSSVQTRSLTDDKLAEHYHSLLNELKTLAAKGKDLPVNEANQKLLKDTLTDSERYFTDAEKNLTTAEFNNYKEFQGVLRRLLILQYDAPYWLNLLTKEVPTLETQLRDDNVSFDDFDNTLEDLLLAVDTLNKLLPTIESEFDANEYQKDLTYLGQVKTYLIKLQEELYSGEDETIVLPTTPVYWKLKGNTTTTPSVVLETTTSSSSQTETVPPSSSKTDNDSTPTHSTVLTLEQTDEQGSEAIGKRTTITRRVLPQTNDLNTTDLFVAGLVLTSVSAISLTRLRVVS